MDALDDKSKPRTIGRRGEDWIVRDQNYRYQQLLTVGQVLTSEMNIERLFEVIMDQTNRIMQTERSTVFLHDPENGELWSLVATGMQRNEIRIPQESGIAGWVFKTQSSVVNNDVYEDPRFFSQIDKNSGFQTRNLICQPLINRENRCIGVLQSLNKQYGKFNDEDLDILRSISDYVAIAVENAKLYENVKSYSEELRKTLIHLETLERVKHQLTKFVPSTVRRLVEKDPESISLEKAPMEVTVLFLDIEGFSKITETADPFLVNNMVENHFSAYLDCIKRYGGDVNETSGDGLMVIFKEGRQEENALAAVKAGLDIVVENNRLNHDVPYPWGHVQLHMGINSGTAYVGCTRMQSLAGELYTYTASGLVTVVAARIGAVSSNTRVYVGPDTYRIIEYACDAEYLGDHDVKNVSEPIPVYWIKAINESSTPSQGPALK
ncbi:hypothetical protein D3OALGA1CA_3220 [Olavius algarvensis associated proteobacterium Delta 3]|nr:hypothetical protein D3OALGB2SA_2787 [Olavius algarvensis associated proteobacterium Delta 3]CAB5130919.1 hypothetical protein D3OALGA1CA_3220 [Olavius algarvensis associated proteobacterium Delta 3]